MPLSNEFFLLVHDERGKSRLPARAIGIALAAGVLAELILTGHVHVQDRRVVARPGVPGSWPATGGPPGNAVVSRYPPPEDSVAHAVFEQIIHEPQAHQVRTWLVVLAPTITDAVAGRLMRLGLVRSEPVGRLRRGVRYVPTDINAGATISVLLARRFTRQDPNLGWEEAVLGGLCRATGLIDQVLYDDTTGAGRRYLGEVMRQVADRAPALIELFANTEAAIGDAVLTHRT